MTVELNNIVPAPIAGTFKATPSCAWANQLTIEPGKNYLVKAESGKGKSTLLNIIYGIRHDYTGELVINGCSNFTLGQWSEFRQTQLAIMFQDLKLFPNLTAMDNLLIKNRLTNHHTTEEIEAMMRQLGLSDKLNQQCGTLSLGQQQRVALIRSLLQPFKWLLLDEPFSHIDEDNQRIASELINDALTKNKAGMLLTSLGDHHSFEYDKVITV